MSADLLRCRMDPAHTIGPPRAVLLTLAACALGLAFLVPDAEVTRRIFGTVPAPLVVLAAALMGWWAVGRLPSGDGRVPLSGLMGLGAAFLVPAVVIDLVFPFPEGLNMALPGALAFYPVAGFVAEVVFHLLPLALMTLILGRRRLPIWAYLPAVVTEPVFQALGGGGLTAQGALVAVHVAGISVVQLWIFKRHGFAAMYALRLCYYLFWHLAWGTARLSLLF